MLSMKNKNILYFMKPQTSSLLLLMAVVNLYRQSVVMKPGQDMDNDSI